MSIELTSDQFMWLWQTTGPDVLPPPLSYRPTTATLDERAANEARLDTWLRAQRDRYIPLIETLRHAQLTISVYAELAHGSGRIRMLGAARGTEAVLVEQLPGREPELGGDIRIFTGPGHELTASVMQALPKNRPGRARTLIAHHAEVRAPVNQDEVLQSVAATPAQQMRSLLRRERVCTGFVRVTTSGTTHFTWIDVADDGRYLVRGDDVLQIDPCTPQGMYEALGAAAV